ncbi:MAG: radical SAM protein, partial [bacterium]|nr:radical SAM protein [bacterium]
MKKIIFIEPRSPSAHIFSLTVIPRLGTLLLGTILKQHGYEVRVYIEDMTRIDYSDVVTADLVGISTITSTAPRAYAITDKIRTINKNIPLVFGGPHPSFLPEEALQHCDYVVRGEGEHTLRELITVLENQGDVSDITGLSYKAGTKVVHTPTRPFLSNLDENPSIDYSLIPNWNLKNKLITLSTSRGCPFNCKFCSVIPMFGKKYRFNSIDHIISEIRTYAGEVGHIFFCDDNFTANKKRTKQLLRRLLDEKIEIEWSAQVRADAAQDAELLDLMQQTGCFAVFIGFESINPKTLEVYDKHQTVEEIRKSINAFHQRNIYIHGMFVLGSDYDTVDTIRETTKFAKKLDIDSVQFMMLTPLPGTQTYAELFAENRITNFDWSKYDAHHAVYEPKQMTAYELQKETYRALWKFYTWRSILARLLRFDFFYAGIKLYGKRSLQKTRKPQRAYRLLLKESLLENIAKLKSHFPEAHKIKRIGIPANMVDRKYRIFLLAYFKKLGMKVTFAEDEVNDKQAIKVSPLVAQIQGQVQKLRNEVDVVILPYIDDLSVKSGELWQKRTELTKLWLSGLQNTKKTTYLAIELKIESLSKSCSELGLLLNKKLRKGRKAY